MSGPIASGLIIEKESKVATLPGQQTFQFVVRPRVMGDSIAEIGTSFRIPYDHATHREGIGTPSPNRKGAPLVRRAREVMPWPTIGNPSEAGAYDAGKTRSSPEFQWPVREWLSRSRAGQCKPRLRKISHMGALPITVPAWENSLEHSCRPSCNHQFWMK